MHHVELWRDQFLLCHFCDEGFFCYEDLAMHMLERYIVNPAGPVNYFCKICMQLRNDFVDVHFFNDHRGRCMYCLRNGCDFGCIGNLDPAFLVRFYQRMMQAMGYQI